MTDEDAVEIPLTGGWVTGGVVRVVETVRRPPGPNASLVHRLLDHLDKIGFEAAPRFLGFDNQRREVMTYIEGEVPPDCRSLVWADEQLTASVTLLRRLHDATAGCELAATAEVVCHHDFGPWNLVWRSGLPVAVIDFDNAAPGTRLDDLGYAIWKHLNIGLIELAPREQGRRLRLITEAYGVPCSGEMLQAIAEAQERMQRLVTAESDSAERNSALSQNRREQDWLSENRPLLLG